MKKVFSVLTVLLLCFSMPVTANASTVSFGVAQPYYEKATRTDARLYIDGTTAKCESLTNGYSDVVEITADQYLQKQGFLWIWSTYDDAEWTKTVYSNTFTMSNTKSELANGKYRLKTVFTLTDKDGKRETITVYSEQQTIG